MDFRTKIKSKDIDIQGEESITDYKHFDITPSEFEVEFSVDLECREWGIKSLCAYATRIIGSIFLIDMETGEEKEIVCNEFKVNNENLEDDKVPLTVESLTVDLKDKIIFAN